MVSKMPVMSQIMLMSIKIKRYNIVVIYRLIYSFNVIPNNILQDFMVLQVDSQKYIEVKSSTFLKSWIVLELMMWWRGAFSEKKEHLEGGL